MTLESTRSEGEACGTYSVAGLGKQDDDEAWLVHEEAPD
jgi:hypothetical protein